MGLEADRCRMVAQNKNTKGAVDAARSESYRHLFIEILDGPDLSLHIAFVSIYRAPRHEQTTDPFLEGPPGQHLPSPGNRVDIPRRPAHPDDLKPALTPRPFRSPSGNHAAAIDTSL